MRSGSSRSSSWVVRYRYPDSNERQLNKSLVNWLASAVYFALITFFFVSILLIWPHPLPTTRGLERMTWCAVIGDLVGAVQVFAGVALVNRVGAGTFVGITVAAALVMSLVVDSFGWFRMRRTRSACGASWAAC
jgi:bacterial/archaeal transporter family-2 protein